MARIFFVTIFALLVGTLLALKPTVQELQSAKQAAIGKLNTLWGVKPSDLQIVQQEGRRLQAASGWMFATTYSGDECHGAKRADIVVGFAADVCLSTKREAGIPARSFIFTCTENAWNMARYNNYNCKGSGYLGSNVIEVSATNGECAAYPPESTATDDGFPETMARYYCETGSEADLMSNYVLSKYYDSDSCAKLGSFDGMRNRGCFAYDFDGSTYSVLTDYPNEYFFPNGHCGGEPIDEALMDDLEATCVNAPTSDDDDSVDDVTWTGFTSEISCSMPSSSECGYPGEETDNTPLKTGQVVGLVIGTIGGAAIVLTSAYFIFLYATASKGAEAGAGATAAGAV